MIFSRYREKVIFHLYLKLLYIVELNLIARLATYWGIPGGILEMGETFEETVKNLELFGIYSGKNGFAQYSNGDKVFSVQMIFPTTESQGVLKTNDESRELCLLSTDELPKILTNTNPHL